MLSSCHNFFLFAYYVVYLSRSLNIGVRSRELCNEAWHYLIHLVVCVTQRSIFDYDFIWLTVMSKM